MTAARQFFLLLLTAVALQKTANGYYVPYQEATEYSRGDAVPLFMNRLHSPHTLASLDYSGLPVCNYVERPTPVQYPSAWLNGLRALHGDVVYDGPDFGLRFLEDQYCASTCGYHLDTPERMDAWKTAIDQGFVYDIFIDAMPVGSRYEDQEFITTSYWGGVPVGRRGPRTIEDANENPRYNETTDRDVFVYNHWNIEITYAELGDGKYSILQTIIEPFSLQAADLNTQERLPNTASCVAGSNQHTSYEMLAGIQPQIPEGFFRFTYDVHWTKSSSGDPHKRWNKFLQMEGYEPLVQNTVVQVSCLLFAVIICLILFGTLWTWVMRDLSYKPLMSDTELELEDPDGQPTYQSQEVQLWPLSTHVFFAPEARRGKQLALAAACGQGAHLFIAGFFFLLFFQVGVIHMALGSRILEPAIVLYVITSPVGGYVAAKLMRIFHGDFVGAVKASFASSFVFPVTGLIVVWICYDLIPRNDAPHYHAVSSCWCFILLWILAIIPLNILGGWIGYRSGNLTDFPVSAGSFGYHDLNLQQESDKHDSDKRSRIWNKYRTEILFGTAGLIPMLGAFNAYAYGVAGPVYQGFYVSSRLQVFLPYCLFCLTSAGMAMFFFYRQLRAHKYTWWWPAFWVGASSGLYTFFLAMTWLIYNSTIGIAPVRSVIVYMIWFLFVSTGVSLVTGFMGVLGCIGFCRSLYRNVMRRCDMD